MFQDSQIEKYLENPINKARYEPAVSLFRNIAHELCLFIPNPYYEYSGLFYYGRDNSPYSINLKYIGENEYNEIVLKFADAFEKYLFNLSRHSKNYSVFIHDCKAIYRMLKREFNNLPDPNFEEIVMSCINIILSQYLKNYFECTYKKIGLWQQKRKSRLLRKTLDLDETVSFGII